MCIFMLSCLRFFWFVRQLDFMKPADARMTLSCLKHRHRVVVLLGRLIYAFMILHLGADITLASSSSVLLSTS